MQNGQIYSTQNSGNLRIINYVNAFNVTIEFIDTQFTKLCRADHIRKGHIKDPYVCSVYGRGYIGLGNYKCSKNRVITPAYDRWQSMLQRCYDPYVCNKYPSYRDCFVAEEWLNFQSFANWFYKQEYIGKELDKDILVHGNKLYSPSRCALVTPQANVEKACAKYYQFINPEGKRVEVYNVNAFAKETGLQASLLRKVHRGERPHHKQWRKYVD